jgi:hypothetical protein
VIVSKYSAAFFTFSERFEGQSEEAEQERTRSSWLMVLTSRSSTREVTIADYIDNLPLDAEEVDLSSFEVIEDFDDATRMKLEGIKGTMKRVKLPPSLLTIRGLAFYASDQLTDVTFPSSLRSIEFKAFFRCSGLAMRDMKLPDTLEELGSCAFAGCSGLTGKLSTHITGRYSLANCRGLSELDLDNCKVIEQCCFMGCTGLIGPLVLPSSLQSIKYRAFYKCRRLTGSLIIPPFVKFIHPLPS